MRSRNFFSVKEASSIIGGNFYPEDAADVILSQNFKVDSRQISRGDVFVAVRGTRTDGHEYIAKAAEAGASAIIAERAFFVEHEDELRKLPVIFLVMPESEKSETGALLLAKAWLANVAPKIVGITGSVGKTTARQILAGVLNGRLRTHAAEKSYNTLIGCSLTTLAMSGDTEVLLLELGTNHPGEISELVANFPVEYAVITEISPAHLEGLKSLEGVLKAKMEIAESKKLKFLSYNFDNDILRTAVAGLDEKISTIGVGFGKGDIAISSAKQRITADVSPRLEVAFESDGAKIESVMPIYGRQNALNVAFAYSIARELGLSEKEFTCGLENVKFPSGRGGVLKGTRNNVLIDDSYNANPDSVSYALRNALELEMPGDYRRIAILGGMRELGDESESWHEVVMSRASLFDEVYLIGAEWDKLQTRQAALRGKCPDAESFIADFDFIGVKNSIVLIKGSRYYELERLLPLLGLENPAR